MKYEQVRFKRVSKDSLVNHEIPLYSFIPRNVLEQEGSNQISISELSSSVELASCGVNNPINFEWLIKAERRSPVNRVLIYCCLARVLERY